MALITLRRNFCHLSDFRIQGALTALKNHPINHVHKVAREHLHPWFCSVQSEPFRIQFHHACCKTFHSQNGNELHLVGEPAFSQGQDWNRLEQNLENENEQIFYRRLNEFTSSEEVLSFVSTLETLTDAMAAGALRRICEVEKKGGDQQLPKEILESSVFRALCFRFGREPSQLSDSTLVTTLQALILLHVDTQSSLILNLVAECQNRLKRGGLHVHDLCVLGDCLIRLQGPECVTLELIICQLQGEKLEAYTPEDIVALYRILQACAEKVDQHQTFLNMINSYSLSIVSYLSPKSISQLLTALVVLDQTQALPLVIKLGKYVVRHIPRFSNEELRKVIEAFIYFGHNDRFFIQALEQHITVFCLTLDAEVVSKVMEYCSRKLILSKPILNAVAETFVCQSEKLSLSQISELIEPFGKLNYLPPNAPALFRKLEHVLFTQFNYFPPKTLLRLLHSCSLIECHPVNFMEKIFSPFFLQKLQGEESHLDRLSMAQLTQLYLTSVLECPFYKGPKLLPKYQVKSFLTPCCSLETPVDFQLYKSVMIGLIDLLGARSYFASKVLTPYCYMIDVEIKLDEEGFVLPYTVDEDIHKRVALCIDGPKRFCSNSKHLLGREAIKQRHLRLLGYQVVQVPYHEMEVLRSRQELVEYLQRKLFPENSTIHW
ncbi:FAST kinase domain-containing protein 3, mitochondrial [Sciurus carolinensis]|uniref:FAST kinase domain-containing protein 3, mitochondrial n=1 Tax=Sciurus carolinensis TaxID=30640 RepID=UPI001FB3A611|nr:FAST kinase domain-containing protein 3, mitochondrial [Sciurus carolinensis]XP_047411401.1 FAST kinase domain-containing protein 3, mitochondrial [Sciurus carolinensis]XP_047411402.1 FAST kinase domain-containing protein 3, mitochondrial [Sciurus carolinensis]XP_047411404.1 FAST kinase domain-containing protein 3, mitochondrial [Sciurus carolinensis]